MKYIWILFVFFGLAQLNSQTTDTLSVVNETKELDSLFSLTKDVYGLIQKSKHSEALKISNEILAYEKAHKNDSLRGTVYNLLGISYTYLREYDKSSEYFLKSLELYKKGNDTTRLISSYNNLGVFHRDYNEDLEESNNYFDTANKLAKLSNNINATIHPTFNIGINYLDRAVRTNNNEDYKLAIAQFHKTIRLVDSTKRETNVFLKAQIYNNLSTANYRLGNFRRSEEFLNKAIESAIATENLEGQHGIYGDRAILMEDVGKYKEANEMLKKVMILEDSIHKVEKFAEVKAIESQYFLKENEERLKFVKKEKEIQDATIRKVNIYNIILILFSLVLLFSFYATFKKNKQLRVARDKAEHLSKVKSNFYSEISHELRTPLYAVIELSKLLLKENVNSTHKEYLESLNFSGNHLMSLINNVLQLNKVESGKIKLQSQDFNLRILITNIIDSLEFALRDSKNEIYLDYDVNIPNTLVGDSLKLSQVFINLISNAIKFTHKGRIDVRAKLVEDGDTWSTIEFQIKDDGLGVSKEKQLKIFEDFYQEHSKNENSFKGTGLGLSIVKRILDAMKSQITVESEEGEGAVFSFKLRLDKTNKIAKDDSCFDSLAKKMENKTILIVDDNKINQLVTKKILDQFSINAICVDSGLLALEILKEQTFDCVLMDLHMPEIDGYETTKRIREFDKEIPIIALTAASNEEISTKLEHVDMNGHILKPFVTNDFIAVLHKAIQN